MCRLTGTIPNSLAAQVSIPALTISWREWHLFTGMPAWLHLSRKPFCDIIAGLCSIQLWRNFTNLLVLSFSKWAGSVFRQIQSCHLQEINGHWIAGPAAKLPSGRKQPQVFSNQLQVHVRAYKGILLLGTYHLSESEPEKKRPYLPTGNLPYRDFVLRMKAYLLVDLRLWLQKVWPLQLIFHISNSVSCQRSVNGDCNLRLRPMTSPQWLFASRIQPPEVPANTQSWVQWSLEWAREKFTWRASAGISSVRSVRSSTCLNLSQRKHVKRFL